MQETINLIPREERVEQRKTKVVKFSTVLSIMLFVIVGGAGGYFFYNVQGLKGQIEGLDKEIKTFRQDINNSADIEIIARNLFKKSNILKSVFEKRVYYSKLLEEFEVSIPEEVNIDTFSMGREKAINLTGGANDYNSVQSFMNKLLERPVFTQVELNSVGLDNRKTNVNYQIVVSYDEALLNE